MGPYRERGPDAQHATGCLDPAPESWSLVRVRRTARRGDPLPSVRPSSQRPSTPAVALAVLRHAVPLVPLYLLRGSIPAYLVATAFDLALGLVLIVGTTRDRSDPTTVDPRATWLVARLTAVVVLAVFFTLVAAVLAVPIAFPAVALGWATGVDWRALAAEPSFVTAMVAMSLAAAVRAQEQFEAVTTPGKVGTSPHAAPVIGDLDADRRQARAAYAAHVTLIATYVGLSYGLLVFGRVGAVVLPIAYAALLAFYDARPETARRILPAVWRDAGPERR